MENYFDLHFHPVAKNHLGKYDEKMPRENGMVTLTATIEMSKGFMDFTDEVILRMLESQCSVEQLKKGKLTLGVAAISALEFGIASSKGFFSDLMKNGLTKPFDKDYFDAVKEGKVSYLNLFLKEIEQYRKLRVLNESREHTEESRVNILGRFNDSKTLEKDIPNIVFGIEGGHNLCPKKIGNALEYDTFKNFGEGEFFDPKIKSLKDPAKVLESMVTALWDAQMDVLYLTLTHLTHIPEQHLATHAFGTKLLKHPSFYPFGNGLSDLGKKLIDKAYTLEHSTGKHSPVLIDIKHMSLKSRLDLYRYREETRGVEVKNKGAQKQKDTKNRNYTKIPLIATHVGVTGYSINDWKSNLDHKKCVNHVDQGIKTIKICTTPKVAGYWGSGVKTGFTYNPCTINLMDEDIVAVVESGGLIGVGLDVRLLGHESKPEQTIDTSEFLTTGDYMTHFPYSSIRSLDFADAEELRSEEAWLIPTERKMHPLSFCFNIVHILAVIGLKTNPEKKPEKYICVGSDFDGFIEPLNICGGSDQMKELESNMLKWLPVAAKRYQRENGGTADLFKVTKKKKKLKKIVAAILYESGTDFLKEWGYFDMPNKNKPKETPEIAEAKK